MVVPEDVLQRFAIFRGGTGGLDSWLGDDTPPEVMDALISVEEEPLSRARFNQLLTLAHEGPVSEAFFRYYWLETPSEHPYDVTHIPEYDENWLNLSHIHSLDQMYWGLYRFYVDALLFFGNVRFAFQVLRGLSDEELRKFYRVRRVSTEDLTERGKPMVPATIAKDNRYLISEMACKSYEEDGAGGKLANILLELASEHFVPGASPTTVNQLLKNAFEKDRYTELQPQLQLSADDFLDDVVNSERDVLDKVGRVSLTFNESRTTALNNTKLYLSMVGDLDVYVATSMRTRDDFRRMADFCEQVFEAEDVRDLDLRYFDPTLSAAENHEDKGLLECLMVKCAKVLVLHAGDRDSYGKDAEAAMALSLGKPVIIYAEGERRQFFRDVHPLSRLINFANGVAVGAIIASSPEQVTEVLKAILTNDMKYSLEQKKPGYLVLKERITQSVVRLQTSDTLLRETFWNHYHNRP